MLSYIIKRGALAFVVALTVSMLTFGILYQSSDPAVSLAGEQATAADIQAIRESYGFDRPIWEQYRDWLFKALKGDLGHSYYWDLPVVDLISHRIPVTFTLSLCSMGFAIIAAIPLGVLAALHPNSWIDRISLTVAVSAQALPNFWFGLMLIVVFAVMWPILPSSGVESWQGFVLPTIVMGTNGMPAIMRLTRTGMLDVLSSDYIRTARAKGLKSTTVLYKHALRNAVIPVVSVAAVQFGFLLAGSVVTETVFSLQGLGYLAYESIARTDLPTMQVIVLLFSLFFVLTTFISDVLNAWLDPRIRVS
ncbi:ABC transporter permease [Desulfocicer niacini]